METRARERIKKRVIIVAASGAVALIVIALLLAGLAAGRTPKAHVLPISFVGFTNDTRGARLSIFAISNVLSRQIGYSAAIDFMERGAWQPAPWRSWPPKLTVAPNQQSYFFITNPIDGTWRASVLFELTPTAPEKLGWATRRFFGRLNLSALASRVPIGESFKAYTVYGPEMRE